MLNPMWVSNHISLFWEVNGNNITMSRFRCCFGLLVILGIDLLQFVQCTAEDVNVDLICSHPTCSKNDVINEIGETLEVDILWYCDPCTLTVNTTRQNIIRLDIDKIYSFSGSYQSYIVHDGVGTVFTKELTSCYITFLTNRLEIQMDQSTEASFIISTEATNQGSLYSSTNATIVSDCVALVHFDPVKEQDVTIDLKCSDPHLKCTKNDIITEIGNLLAVDNLGCDKCMLNVNTTRQNRIRLDIDNIYSRGYQSYIVHDGIGTIFTKDLTSCYITFLTYELEIHMDRFTRFRISTEATNQGNLKSATNITNNTDCIGLVHVDAGKEPDVIVDFICSDSQCIRKSIIMEIGEIIAVYTSSKWCDKCMLTVNTTRQNRIRLDIDKIYSRGYQSYIVHDGVGTVFTKDLTSCYITFLTYELEIHMDRFTRFRISTEATNQGNLKSATNITNNTDCVGLVHFHFDAGKEPDVNVDLICSDSQCIRKSIITEIGEILAVDTSSKWCDECMLNVNTTRQNRIRLDIDNIYSRGYQSYIVHDDIGTIFTKDLTSCYITFLTYELEIHMDRFTRFRISTEASNQGNLKSATNITNNTDCVGLVHFDAGKEPDVIVDLICSHSKCVRKSIITEIGEIIAVDVSSRRCDECMLKVNTTRQNRIRLDIDKIYSRGYQSYIIHDGVGTVFTKYLTSCYIAFLTNELEIYMDPSTKFRISSEETKQDSLDSNTNNITIVTDCVGFIHFDAEKDPDINVDLICSNPPFWCTRNIIITEIGELLAVDTSSCRSCTLAANTTTQKRIRLDVNNIYAMSQSYIVHDGVATRFSEDITSCFITFPTNELEIHMDRDTRFRISTEATNQDTFNSDTHYPFITDCDGLIQFNAEKEVNVNVDLICSDPWCTQNNFIITKINETLEVHGMECGICTLTVNTARQNRIRLNIISIHLCFFLINDGIGTQFTENQGACNITFPTSELDIYFFGAIHLMISTEVSNQVPYWKSTIHTNCGGLESVDNVEEVNYAKTEVYIESNYKEIQRYVTFLYSEVLFDNKHKGYTNRPYEQRGILPLCPFNCTCSLYNQKLIARCANKTVETLLFHKFKGADNLPNTLDASNRQLQDIVSRAFEGLSIKRLILNKNLLTHIKSETFTSLALMILEIADNMITELETEFFTFFPLHILDLHGNQLTFIFPYTLYTDINLLYVLDLSENFLSQFLPDTFALLVNLIILILDKNNITTLQSNDFLNTRKLQILYLDDNQLTKLEPTTFPNHLLRLHLCGNQLSEISFNIFQAHRAENQLQELVASQNSITFLPQDVFCNTPNLQQFSVADNQLQNVDLRSFANLKQLKFLNISNNRLKSVLNGTSQGQGNQWNFCNKSDNGSTTHIFPKLQFINLNNNNIQMSEGDLFKEMPIIEALSIRENPLRMIHEKTFASVKNGTIVLVDEPATCCFIEEKSQCKPKNPKLPYLTCLRLLPYHSIRVFMWFFGLFALVGNFSVILWRCIEHDRGNNIQVLLIKNLAASDLMMVVYMLIIASADSYYQQYFPSYSSDWRNGPLCKLAGILSVLSSEASVFFITLISVDRFLAIKYPQGKWRLTRKSTLLVLMCLWSFALLLSVIPVSFSGLNQDFYDVSEVCIGLPFVRAPIYVNKTFLTEVKIDENFRINFQEYIIRKSKSYYSELNVEYTFNYNTEIKFEESYIDVKEGNNPGLFFSIVLFLGINMLCFFIVAVTYTWIFITVKQSNKKVNISRTDQEITLAIRMGTIVVTDFMCWAPIIMIGILVQSAIVTIHPVVYVYFVVFLLPINSAINPYIYTIVILLSNYWTRTSKAKKKEKLAKTNIGLTTLQQRQRQMKKTM